MPRIRQSEIGTSFTTGSGFILRSPRILIREKDDNPGAYPSVARDGDVDRMGKDAVNFNDNSAIIFENAVPFFPSMLPRNSSFRQQAVDIQGEESDVQVTVPIRDFQFPTHLHFSETDELNPFDENKIIPASDFYLSGTDPDVLPGFMSPIRSKTSIEIDITPNSDTLVMRNVDSRAVGEGGTSIGDKTGFLYYNFDRKEWDQIGLRDPGTGDSLYYDYAYNNSVSHRTGTFPYQFTHTSDTSNVETDDLVNLGYSKIGSPTILLDAPDNTKYHATSSQTIKLSDYISAPFMLEAIKVEFGEINAQRVNGGVAPFDHDPFYSSPFKSGSIRDIDNYVFFIYRQSRVGYDVDSLQDISSSCRYLIASSSMTFWNSASLRGQTLLHTPTFSHEFGLPYSDSYAVGKFTGSINLDFHPAVCGPQFLGPSFIQRVTLTPALMINAWPGGTSHQNYNFAGTGFMVAVSPSDKLGNFSSKYGRLDTRAVRKFGGETGEDSSITSLGTTVRVSDKTPQSNVSPYLLLPEDELVLGLEAGVGPSLFADNFSHITGSFLRIKNKKCKITLFGSQIKAGEEVLFGLNQKLTSDSVHEVIGSELQYDQFQIEPIGSYYGTYLDEIVTGSLVNQNNDGTFTIYDQDDSRRVIAKVSEGQAGTTGSLQRFVNLIDQGERVYDSCLPDTAQFLNVAVSIDYASEFRDGMTFVSPYSSDPFEGSNLYPKQFPYQGNPKRYLKNKDNSLVNASPLFIAYEPKTSDSPFPRTDNIVFRVGWRGKFVASAITRNFAHRHTSTTSSRRSERPQSDGRAFRYGISNVNPQFTSARWKLDHYGYLRDMLEQRVDTTTFKGTSPVKIKFISGSQVTNSPTLTTSQNLSHFATSSLPYFDDGVARNRSDNPDDSIYIIEV